MENYNFRDYRLLIKDHYLKLHGKEFGMISKLSKICGCHGPYISRVLKKEADLSLEQANNLCEFFKWSEEYSDFFLLLVQAERAGSIELKARLNRKINRIIDSKNRVSKIIEEENLAHNAQNEIEFSSIYYQNCLNALVHMASGLEKIKNVDDLTNLLNFSREEISQCLDFLKKYDVVKQKNGDLFDNRRLHLSKQSPFLISHHRNWRNRADQNLQKNNPNDIHYTSLFSVNKEDYLNIKNMIVAFIDQSRKVIRSSENETQIVNLNLDYYLLNK